MEEKAPEVRVEKASSHTGEPREEEKLIPLDKVEENGVRKKKSDQKLKLSGNSFDAIKKQLEEKADLKKQLNQQQEVNISAEIDTSIHVPLDDFERHLQVFIEDLKTQNKMNLASAIQNGKSTFKHNKWILYVENQIFRDMLQQEQNLVPYLREKLELPTLFLEVEVDESLLPQKEEIPYTEEGKLEAMNKKNPLVQKLQKIFKTRIIYE